MKGDGVLLRVLCVRACVHVCVRCACCAVCYVQCCAALCAPACGLSVVWCVVCCMPCVRVSNGAAVDGISVCTREGSWFLHEVIFMASSEGIDKRFVAWP